MAVYHFSAKVIGRSDGRSAIASAAYRSASLLHDDRLDRAHDYTAKAGVVHSQILLPEGAPARWQDRQTLWNEVEAGEKRRDAQLARDVEISLPRELSQAEAIRLAQDFVCEQFVGRGMVADLNVHWTRAADGELQPHAHVMLTMREVIPSPAPPGGEGRGEREEAAFGKKVAAWNDRGLLRGWRERWAEVANARLAELGHDVRIDHRSYRDQDIGLEPQHKIGPVGTYRDAERRLERAAEHRAIARRNGETLLEDPAIALRALTHQRSTFTRRDLARFVDRHTDGSAQFAQVMARVEAAPELVRLGQDGRGRDRFTTREMLEAERRMELAAERIAARSGHGIAAASMRRVWAEAARADLVLGGEQMDALEHVIGPSDLSLVVGYAGSGKSRMLGVTRAAWEGEGYSVRGVALSGIAAEGLQAGSGIASRTIASLEYAWAQGRDLLTSRDVLVLDEAGMVGSRQMARVLSAAETAGAKVVLVGDPEQLQAIEAGAAFRALFERHGAAELTEVHRQRTEWQREATQELATGRTALALGRYQTAEMVRQAETRDAAKARLVEGWDAARRAWPGESQVILAYTRDDVRDLNERARARMREAGALAGPDQVVATERGARSFAAGDRMMFLRNERGLGAGPGGRDGVAVKNGTLGTVLAVEAGGERLTVRLDGTGPEGRTGGPVVTFSVHDYAHIDHGYAVTVHKAQGVTVDRAHVLATPHMDRHAVYVGLTRHRAWVALHYAREDFADAAQLARVLGRERAKDTTLDYANEREAAWRYAERRGLAPESEIVVRAERGRTPTGEAPSAASLTVGGDAPAPPRRSEGGADRVSPAHDGSAEQGHPERRPARFAGLRLGPGASHHPPPAPAAVPAPVLEPARAEARPGPLPRGLAAYAEAWEEAARMGRAGLPVLAHQARALERARQALEALTPDLGRDARAALERRPELARSAGTPEGLAALRVAAGAERQARLALDERGRAAVRAWGELERAYGKAEREHDWSARREVGARMEAFGRELKRDVQLDALLRQRGRELGVSEGSRLELIVRAGEAELSRTLRREPGPGLGRGMGMEM